MRNKLLIVILVLVSLEAALAQDLIFFEDFESGDLTLNNWTINGAEWKIIPDEFPIDLNHVRVKKTQTESSLETNLDTVGFVNISIIFYYKTANHEPDEYINADWFNGSIWIPILSTTGDVINYTQSKTNLTIDANNNPDIKIRFRCLNNHNSEACFVDNITVIGTEIVPPLINITYPLNASIINNPEINLTTDENATCTYAVNPSFVYENGTVITTNPSTNHNIIVNNLTDGDYSYYFKCKDKNGNINNAINQGNINFILDTTPPAIDYFLSPSYLISQIIEIDVDITDENTIDAVIVNLTYPNLTTTIIALINVNGSKYNASLNIANQGIYNLTFIANDSINNINIKSTYFNAYQEQEQSASSNSGGRSGNSRIACNDGKDNDDDGFIDLADPGCVNRLDQSETDSRERRSNQIEETQLISETDGEQQENEPEEQLSFAELYPEIQPVETNNKLTAFTVLDTDGMGDNGFLFPIIIIFFLSVFSLIGFHFMKRPPLPGHQKEKMIDDLKKIYHK